MKILKKIFIFTYLAIGFIIVYPIWLWCCLIEAILMIISVAINQLLEAIEKKFEKTRS